MSGAQGAQPKGNFTATTYEAVSGGANKTRESRRSKEDAGGIQVKSPADKDDSAAGLGGPAFGRGTDLNKQDTGATGTGGSE